MGGVSPAARVADFVDGNIRVGEFRRKIVKAQLTYLCRYGGFQLTSEQILQSTARDPCGRNDIRHFKGLRDVACDERHCEVGCERVMRTDGRQGFAFVNLARWIIRYLRNAALSVKP